VGARREDSGADGKRFALATAPEGESVVQQDRLVFVFNFFDQLQRIAPASRR
jgi:hypothetical protein